MKVGKIDKAAEIFREHGGVLRTAEALRSGIHPRTLYEMRDSGLLEKVSRGVYRLASSTPLSNPDLVTVASRIPRGVICLISALSFHDLTTQIPHQVHVALPSGASEPRLEHPPIKTYRFGGHSFAAGVERHDLDGVRVHIYGPEKTLADCFKFRNRIGVGTAVEALRCYRERGSIRVDELVRYAEICRVRNVMRPYLEAVL